MRWKGKFALGLAAALASAAGAHAQFLPVGSSGQDSTVQPSAKIIAVSGQTVVAQAAVQPEPKTGGTPETPAPEAVTEAPADPGPSYGPTPLPAVKILQGLIFGDRENPPINVMGWADFDYTYNSVGRGISPKAGPGVAPVMNRFGDEFLVRQLGIYLSKPTTKELSWGFNAIFIGGADASFLGPTAGGWANPNPRFGSQFTDLNLTAHLPILTEGGLDIKAGRQTTCLGPIGALAWQRPFTSSDYAWYNMEEGRYTGVSTVLNISKQLSWYNGVEIGGWGVFYANQTHNIDYLTQVNYWLDEDAKKTKVWTTILTGPTSFTGSGLNTTVLELGIQHNFSDRLYQIVDSQMVWSKAPIFGPVTPGYTENAYDVYTYIGYHLNCKWDATFRAEWYYDQNGGGYAGGFGVPKTTYLEFTWGPNYHPTKWLEFRPEIRYDHASNPNFGANPDSLKRDMLTVAMDVLFKF